MIIRTLGYWTKTLRQVESEYATTHERWLLSRIAALEVLAATEEQTADRRRHRRHPFSIVYVLDQP